MRNLFAILFLAISLFSPVQAQKAESPVQSLHLDLNLSDYQLVGQGKFRELIVVTKDGRLLQLPANKDGMLADPVGEVLLEDPSRSLLSLVSQGDSTVLYCLSPQGLYLHRRQENGLFEKEGQRLVSRARFSLRLPGPQFSNIIQDVNGDGWNDLVIPGPRAVELWLQREDPKTKEWAFERTAEVRVKISLQRSSGTVARGDSHEEFIVIPDLDLRDVNGDGRKDIVIVRGGQTRFHRQREDMSYPETPDVILDLDKFQDTTPRATLALGRTLAGTEKARQLIRDLDDDGIPDYVVAHRRKVWVFHGSTDGPQFTTPSTILKTADDITGIWLADIDTDGRADLLVMRVEVPTIGTLIAGLFGSIEVDMRVLGYRSMGDREFDKKPTWSNSLEFKLPSLGEILKDPEAIISRFDQALESFRKSFRTDINADGKEDLILFDEAVTRAEIYHGRSDLGAEEQNLDVVVREVFFDEKNAQWDLDRLFDWIASLGNAQVRRWTDGRSADEGFDLRKDENTVVETVLTGDLDGDGASELVVVYRLLEVRGQRLFDVWRINAKD